MPSVKVLENKKQVVAGLSEKLHGACAGVLVDYKGINVADDTALRRELREAGVNYTVVKNTLMTIAVKDTSLEGLNTLFTGTTALAISTDDYVAAARILAKFAETHKNFSIKGGFIDGEIISVDKVDSLAKLPTREILLATVVYAFQAPIAALARAVKAVEDKKNEGSPAEAVAEGPAEEVSAEEPAEAAETVETNADEPDADEPDADETAEKTEE